MLISHIKPPHIKPKSIFLAGGITNCPDWQSDVMGSLKIRATKPFILLNPRRDDWKDLGFEGLCEQVNWEYRALREADLVLFWFPKETICPITLFELGGQLELRNKKNLIVGCHEDYNRKLDLLAQLEANNNKGIPLQTCLNNLINQVVYNLENL